jgi:hypothetical protein
VRRGSFYVLMVGFVDPDGGLGVLVSVQIVIVAALGGAGLTYIFYAEPAARRGAPGRARPHPPAPGPGRNARGSGPAP